MFRFKPIQRSSESNSLSSLMISIQSTLDGSRTSSLRLFLLTKSAPAHGGSAAVRR